MQISAASLADSLQVAEAAGRACRHLRRKMNDAVAQRMVEWRDTMGARTQK